MQSHPDFDMEKLERRAKEMRQSGQSIIAGGFENEPVLLAYESHGMHVAKRPNDPQGILRISVGGGVEGVDGNYLVFRGDRAKCEFLLRSALGALEAGAKHEREQLR